MFRRPALPFALATVLVLAACATTGPSSGPLSTPQVSTTDASEGVTEPGTAEQDAAEQGTGEQDTGEQGATDDASESPAVSVDALSSTAAALNGGEPGLPRHSGASIDDVLRLGAVATWVDAPRAFAISLPASTDCWASAGEPAAVDGRVVVRFVQQAECAAADAARTYTLAVPDGIDTAQPVEIAVQGLDPQFTLTLPEQ